jgi:hypothetical protein
VITAAALVASSFVVGYTAGKNTQPEATGSNSHSTKEQSQRNENESDNEEEDVADGDFSAVKPGFMEPCKMVGGRQPNDDVAMDGNNASVGFGGSYGLEDDFRENCCTVSSVEYSVVYLPDIGDGLDAG